MRHATLLVCVYLIFIVLVTNVSGAQFVLIVSKDDLKELPEDADNELADSLPEWDDFGDSDYKANIELDSGSWRLIFEADNETLAADSEFYSSLGKLLSASTEGVAKTVEEAITELDSLSSAGHPHAQSVLGFLYGYGFMKEKDKAKSLLYHHFAAQGGNLQSKMVLAYTYSRQDMQEEAVKLYAELAEVAVNSFLHPKVSPVIEPVRIHVKSEENKEALRKSRGEDDEDFKILEYQAQRGNAAAMYKMGLFYYFGLRGLRRDNVKALKWFTKAAEKEEPRAMEHLGEMYARGAGVERNYTTSYHYLKRASRQLDSAYNGMGYLYVKGYGVENQNFTKAKELFVKAAAKDDPGARYNLGVMYLKGVGVKRDLKSAFEHFIKAANMGQPKAFYQLAKMFHKGIGLKKDIPMACSLYKLVAEQGPSSSLSRYALESYVKGDVGKALFLYSRMAELGSEVAQSNAAWILEKYGDRSVCIGESGLCADAERHDRTHSLWWQASEQGNEHAALLIGDAYYYGRGTGRDFERAAEAYQHAKSQSNAQAMFNLGYMHEHGEGLPYDLHLAKRYYDEALESDVESYLAVKLALGVVWLRMNYGDGIVVRLVDALPEAYPKVVKWVEEVVLEEGNATILTLFVCLLTVLYFRERQRRNAAAVAAAAAAAAADVVVPHRFNAIDDAPVFD